MIWNPFAKKEEGPPKARPVLVVDDNPDVSAFMQDALMTAGYEAVVAKDGRTALNIAVKSNPRLILLDINMPGWSGLETLTRLRVHQNTRDIPVLMVTAEQTGNDIEEAFKRGAKGFVIKPVEIMRLIKKVEEHILPEPSPPPSA